MRASAHDIEARRQVLIDFGASDNVVEEVLTCTQVRPPEREPAHMPDLPLPDEAHIPTWRGWAHEAAKEHGAAKVLSAHLPQLRFPICEGMRHDTSYRLATRQGIFPPASEGGDAIELEDPASIELQLVPGPGGTTPVIVAGSRHDFVTLIRALTARNEPISIPDSMGACLVSGYNNWDRVHRYKRQWLEEHPQHIDYPSAWKEEWGRLIREKHRYQDRFIILSSGPYSNVPASVVGLEEKEWLSRSFVIRRDHECTHYLSLRMFGRLRHSLVEELIADFAGIVGAFGGYRPDLALRFLGLESLPALRRQGRLANYLDIASVSEAASALLARVCAAAIHNLGTIAEQYLNVECSATDLARLLWILLQQSLESLAEHEIVGIAVELAASPELSP